ncbi:uncharacterized protein LOC134234415 [Saccostrea cucullata]|uniref:uncharacterized protein LOC134234415 n=1 Tax=Saccostrea cuccullata TaxID=36930 RepID=UPI002ED0F982
MSQIKDSDEDSSTHLLSSDEGHTSGTVTPVTSAKNECECKSSNSEVGLCETYSSSLNREFPKMATSYDFSKSENHDAGSTEHDRKTSNKTVQDSQRQDDEETLTKTLYCVPCKYENLDKTATCFCLTCNDPEPMCQECTSQHLKQKQSRNHKVCYELEKYGTVKNAIMCESCSYNKEDNVAEAFCLNCREPDPMCTQCAYQHKKQKLSRGHKICKDLRKLPIVEKIKEKTQCVPCLFDQAENIASALCLSCEDPEPMCNVCAKCHIKQKDTRGHDIYLHIHTQLDESSDLNQDCKSLPDLFQLMPNRSSINLCTWDQLSKSSKVSGVQPQIKKYKTDFAVIFWEEIKHADYYQIRFKPFIYGDEYEWMPIDSQIKEREFRVDGLKAETTYIFQVRGVKNGVPCEYGPPSFPIQTYPSLASTILPFCKQVKDGALPTFQLPYHTDNMARKPETKIKEIKLGFGNPKIGALNIDEKTVILVGATGCGKSTMVDGIINYIMGVNFQDEFRFTLLELEEEEKKSDNQAISQTEWITVYKIAPQTGSRLDYTLNIIDTPGFGDTRGIERDELLVDQIRHLFTDKSPPNLLSLDCVCFIVKAPDARLTPTQTYIFHSIMSLFGKYIESNICSLITFADGAKPPVLAALNESKLPFGNHFVFNNSALFEDNKAIDGNSLTPMFWDMGQKSFQNFFGALKCYKERSLALTKDVLEEREHLKTVIHNIQPQVDAGLTKVNELEDQVRVLEKHKADIDANRNFEYEVDEIKQIQIKLPPGQHVTNCMHCNLTCHEDCKIADDEHKSRCAAMNRATGKCEICPGHCDWYDHKNTPYIFRFKTEKVKKMYAEMKRKYEDAVGETMNYETYIHNLKCDINEVFKKIKENVEEMKRCKNKLNEIALKPDPLTSGDHIKILIEAQKSEKQPGYDKRIAVLERVLHAALIEERVENLREAANKTIDRVYVVVGCEKQIKPKRKGILEGPVNFIKRFWEECKNTYHLTLNFVFSNQRKTEMADSGPEDNKSSCPPCLQPDDPIESSSDAVVSEKKNKLENESEESESTASEPVGEKIICSTCTEENIDAEATLLCKDENLSLCNTCGRRHKLEQSTKTHEIVRLQDGQMICDLCLDSSIIGYGFCQDCEDPEVLCLPCSRRHCANEEYAKHNICTDLVLLRKSKSPDNSDKAVKDENAQDEHISRNQEELFPKEGCFNCRKENHFVENVCTFCRTRLCNGCSSEHMSEEHKTILVAEFLGKKFPCLTCNADAYHHCHSCNSDFCHECRVDHQANGLLDHEWIDIISHAFILSDTAVPMCCICPDDDKIPASTYCISCHHATPLCENCSKEHLQKYNDHVLCHDMSSFNEESFEDEENYLNQNSITKCVPCAFDQDDSDANCFCLSCKEPEPMCNKCAAQHVREKKTRGHEICQDLTKFPLINVSSDVLCENCTYNKVQRVASAFCITCEEPEPMCEDCITLHLKQKKYRNHEICRNVHQLIKSIMCEPCKFENVKNVATHFCVDCEDPEPMCPTCANQHLKQRSGRGHTLNEDLSKMPDYENAVATFIQRNENGKQEETKAKTPGKPKALKIQSDSVELFWIRPNVEVDYYQIRYKSKGGTEKWKFVETEDNHNQIIINGLMADTVYTFQVRGVHQDQEGSYGPENSGIKTTESLATYLLKFSIKIENTNPPKYQLLTQENRRARNPKAKTRQLILGNPRLDAQEDKTILLVGATGSGKSTLVDGIVNYVMGVSFDDPFRFTLVQLEEEEKKTHNQAISQTEWITVYKIAPHKGSRLNYTLNIIDTPGFGDTRGIDRDHAIIDQIRHLFSAKGQQGVLFIDAVCFIVKAPDARLTVSQKYIFSSIMSLFGKDIESNICTLITFADGAEPPVLASLTEANLPFGSTFQFNNSALFAENKNLSVTSLSPMFWEMGCRSFQKFFDQLGKFETRSLSQTKDVLEEREQLKTIIANILPQVKAGLSKLGELRDQLEIFKRHKDDIENNKDFTYKVDETKQYLIDLPKGQHVTNCLQCNVTCHERCAIADDSQKRGCAAMRNGYCKVCVGKCIWSEHKNTPYIFKYVVEKVTKTYTEMKQKYEKAKGSTLTHEKYIEELTYDIDYLFGNVTMMMSDMKRCKARLKEIALRPDPLSAVEHIDLLIQAEETEKQPGFRRRIMMLNEIKRMALVDKHIENFDQSLRLAKNDVTSAVGKTFRGSGRAPKSGNIVQRGVSYLKSFFQ